MKVKRKRTKIIHNTFKLICLKLLLLFLSIERYIYLCVFQDTTGHPASVYQY